MTIDVEPTAEVIDRMSLHAEDLAATLRRCAQEMRKGKDFYYASEAQSAILHMLSNCRLDLLIVRPLREYERGAE